MYLNQAFLKFAYLQQKSLLSLSACGSAFIVCRGVCAEGQRRHVHHILTGRFPCLSFVRKGDRNRVYTEVEGAQGASLVGGAERGGAQP